MEIRHRIGVAATAQDRKALASLGVVISEGLVFFDIEESNPSWPRVAEWIKGRGVSDVPTTLFSQAEISEAAWLKMTPEWHWGYPQPESHRGYLEKTYDTSQFCPRCGVGAVQKGPFRMKGEPRWGRRGILQLNWVFDEFFAKPEVFRAVFEPFGITSRPALDSKGRELKTVLQLVVGDDVDVVTDGLEAARCAGCGEKKYEPVVRGPFPALRGLPRGHLARAKQYFGSGARAFRPVLLSQAAARALQAQNVRGVSLWPVGTSPASYV